MAFELERGGKKEQLSFGKSEIDRLIKEREKFRTDLNAMEDTRSRRSLIDPEEELGVDRARAQASELQTNISAIDAKIEEMVKKSKTMEELERRPGAKQLTTAGGSLGSVLVGGSSQQSVLTSVL